MKTAELIEFSLNYFIDPSISNFFHSFLPKKKINQISNTSIKYDSFQSSFTFNERIRMKNSAPPIHDFNVESCDFYALIFCAIRHIIFNGRFIHLIRNSIAKLFAIPQFSRSVISLCDSEH